MKHEWAEVLQDDHRFLSFLKRTAQADYLAEIEAEVDAELVEWARQDVMAGLAEWFWMPVNAGQALVAAGTAPIQEHAFETDMGAITMQCSWGAATPTEPDFIWLSWDSQLTTAQAFTITFINPATMQPRYTIQPGTFRTGEQAFSQADLGFDPTADPWFIAVNFIEG